MNRTHDWLPTTIGNLWPVSGAWVCSVCGSRTYYTPAWGESCPGRRMGVWRLA